MNYTKSTVHNKFAVGRQGHEKAAPEYIRVVRCSAFLAQPEKTGAGPFRNILNHE
jgi:hypothetical protein